jgi:hypothetical protein
VSGGVDRAIRVSTAAAVLGVAGIAAYVSYQHAFEVVRAHGESGLTARLEPATIDGLVYSSSMVILYAARHRLPGPGLARWLLALGILATLAANVAHGWPDGPVGAVVAAWPAASLVGSYELLLWLIRTGAACAPARERATDQLSTPARYQASGRSLVPVPNTGSPQSARSANASPVASRLPDPPHLPRTAARASEPNSPGPDHVYRPRSQGGINWTAQPLVGSGEIGDAGIDGKAAAAYRASLNAGEPLSERKLAAMFGKTSRRWARNRMADARQTLDGA